MIGAGEYWTRDAKAMLWDLAGSALTAAANWCHGRARKAVTVQRQACNCFDCQWPTSWAQRQGH